MTTNATTTTQSLAEVIPPLDRDCRDYLYWKAQEKEAKDKADTIKARIQTTVERFGIVPTNAEKSRRVEGKSFVATVTIGTTVEIDDAKCTELELLLSRARCPKAFQTLFTRRSEFSLAPKAHVAFKTTSWPKRFRDEITSLYASCFQPKTKTPSLEVLPAAKYQEREAKAAAKKAGKKAA